MSDQKPRREDGTGSVECTGKHWRFICPNGAGGVFKSKSIYPGEQEALWALADYRKKISSRRLVTLAGITLNEYAEHKWLPRVKKHRRPNTYKMHRSHWKSKIAPSHLGPKPLVSIARRDIREFYDGLTVTRPDAVFSTLSAILSHAVDDDIIPTNPARDVRIERPSYDPKGKCPTPAEARAFLGCKEIPWDVRAIFMLALMLGTRPGEWRSLEIDDVHLDTPIPYVLIQYGGDDHAPTKDNEPRKVPLIGHALVAMRSWMARLPVYAPHNPQRLVFPFADGSRRTASYPFGRTSDDRSKWHDFIRMAGIKRRIVPHSLRHGAADYYLKGILDEKLDAWEVQVLLGHAHLTTTLTYLHPSEDDLFARLARSSSIPDAPPTLSLKSLEIEGFQHAETAAEACSSDKSAKSLKAVLDPILTSFKASAGMRLECREPAQAVLDQMVREQFPTLTEARDLAQLIASSRLLELVQSDPVLSAALRVHDGGPHYLSRLLELLDLVIPDATSAAPTNKEGAR